MPIGGSPPEPGTRAMPASTVPMIAVKVSSVTPTYGASRRPARISRTSTAVDVKKTSARAVNEDMLRQYCSVSVPPIGVRRRSEDAMLAV